MNPHVTNFIKVVKTRFIPKLNNAFRTTFSDKYLLYTNIGLSVTLSGLGDCIEQYHEILVYDSTSWDKIRTRNMSVFGVTIGTFCHYWYNYLDRRLPGYAVQTVVKKIVIDQFVCSPVCIVSLFVTTAILQGQPRNEMFVEMKEKAWKLYVAEWVVWPAAQFINFYFLPTRFRVLYDNVVSLGYDVYTSYVKHINEVIEKNEHIRKD